MTGAKINHKMSIRLCAGICAAAGMLAMAQPAAALGYGESAPVGGPAANIDAPKVLDKANALVPQDLSFTDSTGKKVSLSEIFTGKRPVIVVPVYFNCPNLCGYTQDQLVNTIKSGPRGLSLGQDYDVVVVSIDPDETSAEATARRTKYLSLLGRSTDSAGLTYLTGDDASIRALTDAVGFQFKRNFGVDATDTAGKFAHTSAIFVCTPSGRVSQTIQGLSYTGDELHNALLVASEGKIGGGLLGVGLSCGAIKFNPLTGKYEQNPWFWAGTAVGGASFGFMAIFLGILWLGEWKKKKQNDDKTPPGMTPGLT